MGSLVVGRTAMTVFAANRMTLDEYRRLCAADTSPPRPSGPFHSPTPAAGASPGAARAPQRADGPSTPPRRSGGLGEGDAAQGGQIIKGAPPCHSRRTEGPWMDSRRVYASKLEAAVAGRLESERRTGGLVSYIPAVSIPVGEVDGRAVRHTVDFLAIAELLEGGWFIGKFVEGKGRDLPAGRAKRGAVRALYGTPVEVWGR